MIAVGLVEDDRIAQDTLCTDGARVIDGININGDVLVDDVDQIDRVLRQTSHINVATLEVGIGKSVVRTLELLRHYGTG